MRVTLDATCFIDAHKPSSHAYAAMQVILAAQKARCLELTVSQHTLNELKRKPDSASDLANAYTVLPHFAIGSWDEQVSTWHQSAGTWDDAKRNQAVQQELQTLTKSGASIRGRGAYIDALYAKVEAFVTSDRKLIDSGPAKRIEERFGLRVVTPHQLANELGPA
jgi:hypothetical protein